MPFENPIVGGTVLRIPAIQSPNFVSGVSGWTINADGTAQFNQLTIIVQVSGAALLIYNGAAGLGNLIGSWAAVAGTDSFGNAYPAGISANQGILNGMILNNPNIVSATIISSLLQGPQITQAAISGGTMTETTITFDTTGGALKVYSSTTTTVTFNTEGQTTWTAPAGVTSAKVECWGAGAGGGGGNSSEAGEGGGGGEYAQEPSYPIIGGNVYNVVVGQGGTGGNTGFAGNAGGDTAFDNGGVFAGGGQAGGGFVGGLGGNISSNTIHNPGGTGGSGNGAGFHGGAGGGGSAGSGGAGGGGTGGGVSSGQPGGAAGAGGGAAGGNGGNNGANGSNGNAPGAAGGGAGSSSSATTGSNTYRLSASETFYGSDANASAPPNGQENSGTMVQGGETASGGSFNGIQKALGIIGGSPSTDLSGKTIDSVFIRLNMLHSWFNSGANVVLGYNNRTSIPSSWNAADITSVLTWFQAPGVVTTNLTNHGLGSALQSGAAKAITIGPGPGSISNPNLNYYCYFYGAGGDNNLNPLITVNWHTGSAPVKAGDGASGQVKITYTSGSTLVNCISPVSGTDSLSSTNFPAGISAIVGGTDYVTLLGGSTHAQVAWGADNAAADITLTRTGSGLLTFTGSQINAAAAVNLLQSSTPATPANGLKLWADTSNDLRILRASGMNQVIGGANTAQGSITVTAAASTVITNAYTIPANDAVTGTKYKLEAGGFGTWGSTQQSLAVGPGINGSRTRTETYPSTTFQASAGFEWYVTFIMHCIGSGASGHVWMTSQFTISAVGGTHNFATGATAQMTVLAGSNGGATGEAFDTTASNTMAYFVNWGSTTGAPTITRVWDSFERIGA